MRQAFVFDRIAVLVLPWHEPGNPPERAARVEVRLLADEPQRGSRYAAERVVIDAPVFRADLFDQMKAPPGNLESAHFHPFFRGIEPVDRHWKDEIKSDPIGWLGAELGDLAALLDRGGVDVTNAPWVEADAAALRSALPAVNAAVEAAWATVRT